ncbi:transporter substrate-binding domain-containing protein [Spartinivicinus sp. A2-2]|uniref:Transporter substrate-binding domain-containing protein n=2 Tax=Spartinivicinus poritis TaxID=2994640 RepID=A0ABT5UAB3_9GAMM|nr:transporter substrate-binding domain-containing protein [Spartinivicinus sp. A2-2]MDE1462403.1 transporter substrate-binding domain-containing protein [Spartinivicinus sp. A2-2]
MKYKCIQIFLIAIYTILLPRESPFVCAKDNYIVGYGEFFPFMYTGKNAEAVGLDIQLVKTVFEQAGCTVHFVDMPWSRMVKGMKHGMPVMFSKKTTPREDLAMINQKLQAFKKTELYRTLYGGMKFHIRED